MFKFSGTTYKVKNILTNIDVFISLQKSKKDVSNFDREFTSEAPKLTPTDKLFIMNLDQTEFSGFTYVNPEFIIQV